MNIRRMALPHHRRYQWRFGYDFRHLRDKCRVILLALLVLALGIILWFGDAYMHEFVARLSAQHDATDMAAVQWKLSHLGAPLTDADFEPKVRKP